MQDGTTAAYAIWLAAHDLGLGACWVNPTIQFGIKRILGIPFNKKLVSVLTIGYPANRRYTPVKNCRISFTSKSTAIKKARFRLKSKSI